MSQKKEIIPAILTSNIEELKSQIEQASSFANRVQIDFALEPFITPTSTVRPVDVPELSFPGILEAHIMAEDPEQYFADAKRIGCQTIYFHYEATDRPAEVIAQAKEAGFEVGLTLNPGTHWNEIDEALFARIDILLFMTVIPGKQGNPFQLQVVGEMKSFHEKYSEIIIAADGGIKESNIEQLVAAGAEYIGVGSGIWAHPEGPETGYRVLVEKVS